jgi:hypothetical protein
MSHLVINVCNSPIRTDQNSDNVYKLHGMSSNISYRDMAFTDNFWQQLFALVDTKLCMISAYHPD